MKLGYNKEQALVVYSIAEGTSCFGLSETKAFEICPQLAGIGNGGYPLNMIEGDNNILASLREVHKRENFKTITG